MSAQRILDVPVLSDLPQLHLDRLVHGTDGLTGAIVELIDRCLTQSAPADRIDVFRRSGTEVLLEVHPARSHLGTYVPTWVVAHSCPECGAPFLHAGSHPANGCKLGVVENVLRQ